MATKSTQRQSETLPSSAGAVTPAVDAQPPKTSGRQRQSGTLPSSVGAAIPTAQPPAMVSTAALKVTQGTDVKASNSTPSVVASAVAQPMSKMTPANAVSPTAQAVLGSLASVKPSTSGLKSKTSSSPGRLHKMLEESAKKVGLAPTSSSVANHGKSSSVNRSDKNGGKPRPKQGTASPQQRDAKSDRKEQARIKQQQRQVNRSSAKNAAERGLEEYRSTEWYLAAIKSGFKTEKALRNFNMTVAGLRDLIDPMKAPVCMECGASDIELCQHFLVADAPVAVDVAADDDVLIIPPTPGFSMRWRFMWFESVRRMFTWPRFDSKAIVNHNNRGFDPSIIPDSEVWPEMLMYIRLHLNTSYKIDGVFDREAKMAHCNKLALRYLTDMKIKVGDVLEPTLINKIKLTVARACDQRDDQTLFKENDPRQNFWLAPVLSKIPFRHIVLAGAIISPLLVSKMVTASMRVKLWTLHRLATANAEILAYGSVHALKYSLKLFAVVVRAFLRNTWSGLAQPFLSGIRQLSWPIVRTTFMSLSTNGI